jgi:DNA-binding MarR family transcriptional regulator
MRTIEREPDATNTLVFIHSRLDEQGLTPHEFRVYCHLARRAGAGYAFPGLRSIAETCCIDVKTASKSIAALIERNMIEQEKRNHRQTSLYRLTSSERWRCGKSHHTKKRGVGNDTTKVWEIAPHGVGNDTTQGSPLRESNKVIHIPEKTAVDLIYSIYPRKKAPLNAKKAIAKALKTTDEATLIKATTAFRDAVKNTWPKEDEDFVPYPASWFNAGSYLEDPKSYEKTNKTVDVRQPRALIEIKSTADDPFFS